MKKAFKYSIIISLLIVTIIASVGIIFINNIMKSTNGVIFDKEKLVTASSQIFLYDSKNNEFGINSKAVKPVINIEDLPNHVYDAFISIEDKRFYEHNGLDYKRIAKAVYNNIKSGSIKEGASTISQQLIKNTHLSNERTFDRKIKEMFLTKKLESSFSKKDILETYLNVIYFGEGSYGIEQAANIYFNKSAKDLTVSESAVLAGIIKSPVKYSPIYNYENSIKRRNLVLNQMLNNNKITSAQYELALKEDITLSLNENDNNNYNLYAKAVLNEASKTLNLSEKDTASRGLKIYTYLNPEIQDNLEKVIEDDRHYHKNEFDNIADSLAVIINNKTYGIEAYSGRSKYNLINFSRQPGSVIKPILVYAPAMEYGLITPATQILDEEINYSGYKPKNVGGVYHGYMGIKESISKSLNIPAIKVLEYVGINKAKQFAQNAGIEFDEKDTGYAIALGGFTKGNTLQEVTNSFTPFANGGNYKDARFIKKIENSRGDVLFENIKTEQKIMGEDTAYLMTHMLIDGVHNGTSKKLHTLNYDVAGKTGTVSVVNSNKNTDAYSVAYTTNHTMGVWLGNYSNNKEYELESSNNGGTYATEIIKSAFTNIYKNNKPASFNKPETVIEYEIDAKTLKDEHIIKLADENCPERYRIKEYFSVKNPPREYSLIYNNLSVDDFFVTYENNKATITFTAKDYFDYEIIRCENNKETVIQTVNNKSGKQVYLDSDLNFSTKYSYYVKVYNTFSDIYDESEKIIILTNKKEIILDNIIKKQNEKNNKQLNWYFY